jgi:hypothetical protein
VRCGLPTTGAVFWTWICALALALFMPPCCRYPPGDVAISATVVRSGGGGCAFHLIAIAPPSTANPTVWLEAAAAPPLARVAPLALATPTLGLCMAFVAFSLLLVC